jgi:hypothetical protein
MYGCVLVLAFVLASFDALAFEGTGSTSLKLGFWAGFGVGVGFGVCFLVMGSASLMVLRVTGGTIQ